MLRGKCANGSPSVTAATCLRLLGVILLAAGCSSAVNVTDCFDPFLMPAGEPQNETGGYEWKIEATPIRAGAYQVDIIGNEIYQTVLLQSSEPGLVGRIADDMSGPLSSEFPCPNSLTSGAELNATNTTAFFMTNAPGNVTCTNFTLAVVVNSMFWFSDITVGFCLADCGPPPAIEDAMVVKNSRGVNATFQCISGFRFNASGRSVDLIQISCMADAQWESTSATCEDIDECENGGKGGCHFCNNTIGSYQCLCNDSYEAIGDRCFESCGNPGHPASGFFEPAEGPFVLGVDLQFRCIDGFRLEGDSVLTCNLVNRTVAWSAQIPECVVETKSDGLSFTTQIVIIVVCSLGAVLLLVLVLVVVLVSRSRTAYKSMVKKHSQSSLQSRSQKMVRSLSATSESMAFASGRPEVADNRRSSRRNSRMERRNRKFSSDSLARANANQFQLTAVSGDILFGATRLPPTDEEEQAFLPPHDEHDPKAKISVTSVNSTNLGQFANASPTAGLLHAGQAPSTDYAAIGPRGGLV